MARGKKKEKELTPEEKLQQALVPVDEQPYEIPENWCWVKFGDVCFFQNGYAFKSQKFSKDTGIPIIRISDISDNLVSIENAVKTTEIEVDSHYIVRAGDLLIAMSGATTGKSGIYTSNKKAYLNQRVGNIKIKNESALTRKFRNYYIESKTEEILRNAYGGAQPNISSTKICKMAFPLPPISEQQRIVNHIESLFAKLDEAKEKAQAVVDGYEDRKAAILHKAFTGELTSIKNADSINYVLSEIRKWSVTFPAKDIKAIEKEQEKASIICLPDGRNWIKCTVGAIGRVTNGSTPSRKCSDYWNGNIPWVSSGEVRNNTIYITNECITQKGFDNSSVKLLPKGTILIAMIGEGKTRGQSAILEIEATINQNIAAIVIDHGLVEPEFLWFWFQMNYKKNREKGSGSGPQALNCQRVRELDCICPSIKEQREIVTLLRALILKEEQVNENAEHVIELIDNIKKSILARAFRGELGTNDPTDESAEKLLKRILI